MWAIWRKFCTKNFITEMYKGNAMFLFCSREIFVFQRCALARFSLVHRFLKRQKRWDCVMYASVWCCIDFFFLPLFFWGSLSVRPRPNPAFNTPLSTSLRSPSLVRHQLEINVNFVGLRRVCVCVTFQNYTSLVMFMLGFITPLALQRAVVALSSDWVRTSSEWVDE